MPDSAERGGDFSQALNALGQPVQIFNPATGLPFSGNMIPPTQISPQARALLNFYPLPSFSGDPRYNYQIPIVDRHASRRAAIALQSDLQSQESALWRLCFSKHPDSQPESVRLSRYHGCAGDQHQHQLVAPPQPAAVPESWVPVQPLGDADHALLGESRKRFRRSGNLGEQSRPDELGSAEPHLLERSGGTVRCAKLLQSQSDGRVVLFPVMEPQPPQHHVWRRLPQAAIQLPVPTGPARHVHVYGRGHAGKRERHGHQAAPILPTFCWEFRTRAPSLSAMRINTFGNPFTTPTSRMIGE